MYLLRDGGGAGKGKSKGKSKGDGKEPAVQLLGSGSILREVEAAAVLLADDFGVQADVWSVPSFNELRRDGLEADRWNRLHPEEKPRRSWVERCLGGRPGPIVASTDYVRSFADQIRSWVGGRYVVLGTDGFGRSDLREELRRFFEVDRHHVVVAALSALAEEGTVPAAKVGEAIAKYGIDPDAPAPWKR
jgi:pyruvate dehydrogenase E1 component